MTAEEGTFRPDCRSRSPGSQDMRSACGSALSLSRRHQPGHRGYMSPQRHPPQQIHWNQDGGDCGGRNLHTWRPVPLTATTVAAAAGLNTLPASALLPDVAWAVAPVADVSPIWTGLPLPLPDATPGAACATPVILARLAAMRPVATAMRIISKPFLRERHSLVVMS
jgi:hypothetical protein